MRLDPQTYDLYAQLQATKPTPPAQPLAQSWQEWFDYIEEALNDPVPSE
jgi:hypothetical protein